MATKKTTPTPNPERWMLVLFPLITLTLFALGIIILWAINVFLLPAVGQL